MNDDIKEAALRLLGRREYSRLELFTKLNKKFDQEETLINAVLDELQSKDWQSDERYAEALINHHRITTKAGPFQLLQKLKAKGISEDISNKKINQLLKPEDQTETIHQLATKKKREIIARGKYLSDFEIQQKITQYLVRKGYSLDLIKKTIH